MPIEALRATTERPAHDAILEAVAFGAGRFLHSPDWEIRIEEVLERLGRATQVSRVYVFERRSEPDGVTRVSQRYEWVGPGIEPQIDNPALQGFSLSENGLDRWEEVLSSGGIISANTRELPRTERRPLEAQDILSIVVVPVAVGDGWWGFVGFDECTRERTWSQAEIDALRAFGDILGGAIGRQTLETKLRETEAKYRSLVEQIPAVVYLGEYGPDGDWLYISPQIEQILGYSADEWLAHPHPMTSFAHPDDLGLIREAEERSLRTGETYRAESRMRSRDGGWIWILDEARPVRDASGRILFMQGVMYDVTERRQEEEARVHRDSTRESERRLQEAMEEVHLACLSRDLEGRVTYCNRFLLQLTGWSADEVLGGDWWELCAPDVPQEERDRFLQNVREGALLSQRDATITKRTGQPLHFSWSDTLIRDRAGAVVGVMSIGQDVTQQREADEKLRASERRFRALTENAYEVISLIGEDGAVRYSSPSDERVLGYSSKDVVGTNAFDYVHPEDLPRVAGLFAQIVREPLASASAEFRIRRPDGSWIWVETFGENRLQDGDVRAIVLNTRDISERKRAEDQLRSAEEKYRSLVEQVPAIVYADSIEGDDAATWPTVFISPQIEGILGYTAEEWMDDPALWQRIVHPEDLETAIASDVAETAGEACGPHDYRVYAKDGRLVWLRDQSVIVRDEEGIPRYQEGLLTDVTELKNRERQVAEAEARYRSLVQNLPVGFYIEPADDRIGWTTFVSPQLETITGYPAEEWARDPRLSLRMIHPDDFAAVMAAERHSTDTGDPFGEEYRIIRADATVAWIHDAAVLVRDELGVPLRWEGFMLDITKRKTAEERAWEAEAEFRTLVEGIPGVVYVDSNDPISSTTYLSPQIERLIGHKPEEFVGDPSLWEEVVHPEDVDRLWEKELAAHQRRELYVDEYRLVSADGSIVWVSDVGIPVFDENGVLTRWLGIMLDITKLKEAELELARALEAERDVTRRLRELDEMKSAFLTAVSHELRTPLTAVLGSAITFEVNQDELAAEDRLALLASITSGARKLERLLRDLLDTERLSRGILNPRRTPVDVVQIAEHVVEASGLRSSRPVTVRGDVVTANVDPAMLERILENLLVNAVKHTSADARIWIWVTAHDEGVLIAVEDDGAGVPEELRAQIFEPFFRGPDVPSHAPGVGVGLSLVAQFARLHGGRAWVEDRRGGGASFRAYLPDEPGSASAGPSPAGPLGPPSEASA